MNIKVKCIFTSSKLLTQMANGIFFTGQIYFKTLLL